MTTRRAPTHAAAGQVRNHGLQYSTCSCSPCQHVSESAFHGTNAIVKEMNGDRFSHITSLQIIPDLQRQSIRHEIIQTDTHVPHGDDLMESIGRRGGKGSLNLRWRVGSVYR